MPQARIDQTETDTGAGGNPRPLTHAQLALWSLDQLAGDTREHNEHVLLRLRGDLDRDTVARALNEIVARHEALRTRFEAVEGQEPAQLAEPPRPLPLAFTDLSGVDREAAAARSAAVLEHHAGRSFDLRRSPLARACLVRCAPDHHLLLFTAHRIIFDSWSASTLIRELSGLLRGYVRGDGAALPPLPRQYGDYLSEQHASGRAAPDAHLGYWRAELAGLAPLDLPADRPRQAGRDVRGGSAECSVDPEITAALRRIAAEDGGTLFTACLAAFSVLLGRYARQEDVAVGTPVAERGIPEAGTVIGCFSNTLVIRTDLSGAPSFREVASRTRDTVREAVARRDVPFGRLVRELAPDPDLSRNPLVQVMFEWDDAPGEVTSGDGLSISRERLPSQTARADLAVSVGENADGGLDVVAEYAASLFNAETIDLLLDTYRRLLARACAQPGAPVASLPLVDEPVLSRLLAEAAGPDLPLPDECPHETFSAQAARIPAAVAVDCAGSRLTFAELESRANRLAHHLRERGMGTGKVLGICLPRTPELIIALLGALKSGAAYVPLDPDLPDERLGHMLADARPGVVVTNSALRDRFSGFGGSFVCIDSDAAAIAAQPDTRPGTAAVPDNLAAIVYTSGSTGLPKGVGVLHRNLMTASAVRRCYRAAPGVVLFSLSFSFDVFLSLVMWILCSGGRLVLPRNPFAVDVDEVIGLLRAERPTHVFGPPHFWHTLLGACPEGLLDSIRLVLTGGDACPSSVIAEIRRRVPGVQVVNEYGPAEATLGTLFDASDWKLREGPLPIGTTIPNQRVYLLDDELNLVPPGVPGEVYIGGPGLTWGYVQRPDLTAARFLPDPFSGVPGQRIYRSGDLARRRADGNLDFLGRVDQQVKIGGVRIEPGEVEAALVRHPAVAAAAVVSVATAGDRRLVAYVVERAGAVTDVSQIRQFLLGVLPAVALPSQIVVADSFPVTANGKVDRDELARRVTEGDSAAPGYVPPRTAAEETVAAIWSEVLETDRVGVNDNFFALGGHSLLVTRVIIRLRERFPVPLAAQDLFRAPTVAQLAAVIGGRMLATLRDTFGGTAAAGSPESASPATAVRDSASPATATSQAGSAPLSFAQERLWFLDQLRPGRTDYVLSFALRVRGQLDEPRLQHALDALAARHEVLRTRYVLSGGGPVQVIDPAEPAELRVADLRDVPEADKQARVQQLLARSAQRPFDLARDPMLRALLIQAADDDQYLVLTTHHIAFDGPSRNIVIGELEHLYRRAEGALPAADPARPAIQYAHYAAWQREELDGERTGELLGYWRTALAGLSPLRLSDSQPDGAPADAPDGFVPIEIPSHTGTQVAELAKRAGATTFMALLAAFDVLLALHTGQTDIAVGTPVSDRYRPELEKLVGFFANTVILRADLGGNPSFTEILARVRSATLGGLAHQELPFERLADELQQGRDGSGNPLFQVMFAVDRAPERPPRLGDLDATEVRVPQAARFDLTLQLYEQADGALTGELTYSGAVLAREGAESLADRYVRLLSSIAASPDASLDAIALAVPDHGRRLPRPAAPAAPPSAQCLHELIAARAHAAPGAPAVLAGGDQVSYGELNRRANQLAHRLRELGVGPESPVAIQLRRSAELVIAMLGVLKAGGAYVPLDPGHPAGRIREVLADTRAAIFITTDELAARLSPLPAGITLVEPGSAGIRGLPAHDPAPGAGPDNAAYVVYTSGSTGRPKGVVVPHRGIRNRILWGIRRFSLTADDRTLQRTPIGFDAAGWEIFGPLVSGGAIVLGPPGAESDPAVITRAVSEQHVTVLQAVPSVLRLLADQPGLAGCTSLRLVFSAGEALPVRLCERLASQLDAGLCNTYGPTECSIDVTYWPYLPGETAGTAPIGHPIDGTRCLVLDAAGRPCPAGVTGELHVGGENVARGYLGRADLTAERFVPDPEVPGARVYRTGDLVCLRADGNLEFRGRIDDQVKIRGIRVEPGEVEAVLAGQPGVGGVVVTPWQDAAGGTRLAAYVTARDEAAITPDAVREHAARLLPSPLVPSRVHILERMPLTANGKVDRAALPAPDEHAAGGRRPYVAPRDFTERLVAGVWAELLGADRVGVHDDFFELGGHSLLATQMVMRLRAALRVDLAVDRVFVSPTVAELAAALRTATPVVSGPELAPVPHDRAPLSFAQQRLWLIAQLDPDSAEYVVPIALRLHGRLDDAALRRALTAIVARHEVLRTRYAATPGQPVQVIDPPAPVPVEAVDLTGAPPDGAAALTALLADRTKQPFDLARQHPLRAILARLGEDDHVLLIVTHHIVCDGASMSILARELRTLYALETHPGDGAPALADLPVQYGDYAVWQRARLPEEELSRLLAHWRDALAGYSPLELPTDRPRPPVRSVAGATVTQTIPADIAQAVLGIGREHGATPFMTLLAAFQMLLARYTGRTDFLIGAPDGGRYDIALERLVGCFVNTLVLRADVSRDPSFTALLARVRDRALTAFAHAELPFELLVNELEPSRDLSRNPLVQVMFEVRSSRHSPFRLDGLTVQPASLGWRPAKFDITLVLEEQPDGSVSAEFEYATALYDQETIERMAGHLRTLVASIAAAPGAPLSQLAMMPDDEYAAVVEACNQTARPYPADQSVHGLFAEQAAATPDAVAVVSAGTSLTYRELDERASKLAHLLARRDCGLDTPVGVLLPRGADSIVALLGVLKAGGAYLPLDPDYPAERLASMCEDAGAAVVVSDSVHRPLLPPDVEIVELDDPGTLRDLPASDPGIAVPGHALAALIYTSGSTGRPKGVMVQHDSVIRLVRGTDYIDFGPGQCFAQIASTTFDAATFEIWGALLHGGKVCVIPTDTVLTPRLLDRDLHEHGVTTMFITTTLFNEVVASRPETFSGLRSLLVGGEAVDTRWMRELLAAAPPARLLNAYGPTETTTFATTHPVTEVAADAAVIPIGLPIANTTAYVLDSCLQPVPAGVPGELYIGGPGVARGYHSRPGLTAERFCPDPFGGHPGGRLYRTGDLVRRRPGDFAIEFIGRIDQQIKIRGFRVELGEIEAALAEHPDVRAAAVVTHEPRPGDRRLVAYVVSDGADPHDLRKHLSSRLPDYMVPASWVALDELPMTPNKKLDRHALPAPDAARAADSEEHHRPATPTERLLARIWSELLGVDRIGRDSDFFELGGHSLLATKVLMRVQEACGAELPLRTLFELSTLAGLAEAVDQLTAHGDGTAVGEHEDHEREGREA